MKKWIVFLLSVAMLGMLTACACNNTAATPLSGTMEETVTKLIEASPVEFMGGLMPINLQDTSEEGLWALKSYTGLDSAEKITDAAVYEPVTGSQAFSLVLVRVKNAGEARQVAQQMKDNINPRKWICAGADQVKVAGYGDTVMFIMLDSGLGKTAQSYVDAFRTQCGGKLDFTIE